MIFRRLMLAALVLCSLGFSLLAGSASAQGQRQPLVVFIRDPLINTASPENSGPSGMTRLNTLFGSQRALTRFIRLRDPIPAEAKVVVLVRPTRPLPADFLARLWQHISLGNHLLLALDPPGYAGVAAERETGGLLTLLSRDYGLIFEDTFLAEPWFTTNSTSTVGGSFLRAYADPLVNPITAPLVAHGLPVYLWGARTLRVEPLGLDSTAQPLLYTFSAYATRRIPGPFQPLGFRRGTDLTGKFNVAALSENTLTKSRLAVLADSEMLLNGFGLATVPGTTRPQFLGNRILAERLVAWLLERPVEQWPPLPVGYTWLTFDGSPAEWPRAASGAENPDAASTLRRVHAFRNDSYLYVLAEFATPPGPGMRIRIDLDSEGNGLADVVVLIDETQIIASVREGPLQAVPDGSLALGEAAEIRLPLRIAATRGVIAQVCAVGRDEDITQPQNCLRQPLAPAQLTERDVLDMRFPDGVLALVGASGTVNLREGPGDNFRPVGSIGSGSVLSVLGRNEAGNWIRVQNARTVGWVSAGVLIINGEVLALPVIIR